MKKLGLLILAGAYFLAGCGPGTSTPDPMETPLPRLSIANSTVVETDAGSVDMIFEVTLSSASDKIVTLTYKTSDATAQAGSDYESADDVLSIPAGQQRGEIAIAVLTDTDEEEDEQFLVTISDPTYATISVGDAIGTIENFRVIIDEPGDGYVTPLEYDDYTLLWNDEFTSNFIDPNTYTHELGDHGWGNEELQNYTSSPANSCIEDGKLIIKAIEESPGKYTSARIITRDKFEFAFGRVDIRAKVPDGQGIWPALWMLGSNFGDIGWPACGEIDIMELVGHRPSIVHGTAHYGAQGQGYSNPKGGDITLPNGEKFSEKFHVFSIVWQQDRIDWFMDDQKYFTLTKNAIGSDIWRFNQEFFFILNIAVGGKWPGNPDGTTTFPQQMVVDYIRVFQK